MTAPAPAAPRGTLTLDEASAAYSWADTTEWLHGRNCGSLDCQTCRDLMDATNAAQALVARLLVGRVS